MAALLGNSQAESQKAAKKSRFSWSNFKMHLRIKFPDQGGPQYYLKVGNNLAIDG